MVQQPFSITDPLPVARAAARLGTSRWSVYRWVNRGKILAVRFGGKLYIPNSEIDRILNPGESNAQE